MQQAIIENPASGKQDASVSKRHSKNGGGSALSTSDLEIELGIWLSAVESFVGTAAHPFADKKNLRSNDWTGDLELTISGFTLCSRVLSRLTSSSINRGTSATMSLDELDTLADVVNDGLTLGESLARAKPIGFHEWRSWCRLIAASLNTLPAFEKVVRLSVRAGEASVPDRLRELIDRPSLPFSDRFDLGVVVPGFSRLLRWLQVIERMLQADEPLKPSLLIFARVYEDTLDLVAHINRRLQRCSDEDAELFRALDSASYIASIELRKVFDQELAGLVAVRSAITVYARTETACASLRDNIQQILAGIGKLIEPKTEASQVFPVIGDKLQASLKLRQELASMIKIVRAAEQDAAAKRISDATLNAFLNGPVKSLFYKDRESVERFVEEVLRTHERKALVPILHRFGAYLETLFSHVNNRTVLRDHPFET